jgi:hypothetical protein
MHYCIGCAPERDPLESRGIISPPSTSDSGLWTDRFFLGLAEGEGDVALEAIQGRNARIEGARWSPRHVLDFRNVAEPQLDGARLSNPAHRVVGQYRPNWLPLTGADVAAGVSASDRVALAQAHRAVPVSSAEILADYPLSQDVALGQSEKGGDHNPLYYAADAVWTATRMRERLTTGRRIAEPKGWRRDALRLMLTDEVLLYHPRWLPSGKPMRVYSLLSKLASLGFDLGVHG